LWSVDSSSIRKTKISKGSLTQVLDGYFIGEGSVLNLNFGLYCILRAHRFISGYIITTSFIVQLFFSLNILKLFFVLFYFFIFFSTHQLLDHSFHLAIKGTPHIYQKQN